MFSRFYLIIFCSFVLCSSLHSKSPYCGVHWDLGLSLLKQSISTSTVSNPDSPKKNNVLTKGATLSVGIRRPVSTFLLLCADSFIRIPVVSRSVDITIDESVFRITRGVFGYGFGIGLGVLAAPKNLTTISFIADYSSYSYSESGSPITFSPISESRFAAGIRISNITALSKKSYLKISVEKLFSINNRAFNMDHKHSNLNCNIGFSFKF